MIGHFLLLSELFPGWRCTVGDDTSKMYLPLQPFLVIWINISTEWSFLIKFVVLLPVSNLLKRHAELTERLSRYKPFPALASVPNMANQLLLWNNAPCYNFAFCCISVFLTSFSLDWSMAVYESISSSKICLKQCSLFVACWRVLKSIHENLHVIPAYLYQIRKLIFLLTKCCLHIFCYQVC